MRILEQNRQAILKRTLDIQSDGKIHVQAAGYLSQSLAPHDTLWVTVSSFDSQFYDYFNSDEKVTSFEDLVLGLSPGAVTWNFSGDGIGMFIGKASVTKEWQLR